LHRRHRYSPHKAVCDARTGSVFRRPF
jgi:hypothetical protein